MNLMDAAGMAVAFVVFVIVVAVGAQVLAGVQAGQTSLSLPYNITQAGLTGAKNLGDQSGTIGTVIGAAIIISIVVGAFYFANKS